MLVREKTWFWIASTFVSFDVRVFCAYEDVSTEFGGLPHVRWPVALALLLAVVTMGNAYHL